MPAVQRVGDSNSAGGIITSGYNPVRINNRVVSVDGSPVSPHTPYRSPHTSPVTTSGVGSVRAGGIPINITGNPDSCGHPRVGGSENVNIG
jgi:uncharacterized Zn-binding protein involved in type VI secretion